MTRGTELIDDGLLLRRMIAGDEDAFTLLYHRKHPAIYRFALHMSGNCAVAEDVTQEVFMTLIRDAKRFDPARGTLGGFLFGIARNHLRRRWELERNSVPLPETADELDAMLSRYCASRSTVAIGFRKWEWEWQRQRAWFRRQPFSRPSRRICRAGKRQPCASRHLHASGKLSRSSRSLRTGRNEL